MARLVVSAVVGVAVGFFSGNPALGFQAFAATYGLTGFLDPNQQVSGPRIDDLKGTTAQYGTPIPHVYGHPRIAGAIVWCSDKHEIATTEEAGGKGGPSTDVTTYTYTIDVRVLLTANEIVGVRRIWSNGKLVWTASADADSSSLEASGGALSAVAGVLTTGPIQHWDRLTVYTGAADQMPDPTEEAALGIENCPAYRGRGSVFIEGLNLGSSGYLPNLTFEIANGSEPTADVLLLVNNNGTPGSSSFVDLSSYNHALSATNMAQSAAVAAYGSATGAGVLGLTAGNSAGLGTGLGATAATWNTDESLTIEVNTRIDADPQASVRWGAIAFAGGSPITSILRQDDLSPDVKRLGFEIAGQQFFGPNVSGSATMLPAGQVHLELDYDGSTKLGTLYINGIEYVSGTYTGPMEGDIITSLRCIDIGASSSGLAADSVGVDGVRITRRRVRHSSNFTPPTSEPTDDSPDLYTAADEPLEDVLEDVATRAGLEPSYLDFSSCSGQFVRSFAVSQVTPARTVMQTLGDCNLQEFVEGGLLKTVARGGTSVATLAYSKLGASSGDQVEPLPLKRLNDIELPRQFAITYPNVLNDYQNGTEYSDRLLGGSTSVATTELPVGLTPTEAKRLADVRLVDAVAGVIQVGPVAITREYARLEPTDVVIITGHDGSTFRSRILKITDDGGIRTLECVLDDATAVNSSAVTDSDYESSTIVRSLLGTDLVLFDSPILRDADNDAGIYAAVNRSAVEGDWPGSALFRGVNETGWSEVARYTDRTWIGRTTTALPVWTGGWLSDESSTVTVSGVGELSNYTDDAVINGSAAAYLIGDEVIYARTATLVSEGVYTLSGLYRGRRGTEWAAALGTATGADVVLLQTTGAGVRRVGFENGQLGAEFDFRGVTLGASIGSASTESITPMGVGLKPFAPVHVEADDNGDGTYDVTWQRRTRLSCRFTGSLGINTPLGESSESYVVEVFDGASVTSTQAVSDEAATVTASPGDVVRVYQVSAIVGRGYVAELTL